MNEQKQVKINDFGISFSNCSKFVLIAGPCQIESRNHSMKMCEQIKNITSKLNIPFVFKSSYDKANRSSVKSKRGVGLEEGLKILFDVKNEFKVPVTTDVHETNHCFLVKDVVDIIQIPAFLCRQTDLLKSAAQTKKVVNVKKGQFISPYEVKNIIGKLEYFGNNKILITERGTFFGYNNLVNDFKGLKIMRDFGYPVVFDATHSVQQPGGLGESSGGNREYVYTLAKASLTVGISSLFLEVHDDPDNAPSDGPNQININNLENMLKKLKYIDDIVKEEELYEQP